jgi:hypothetical protein
MYVMKKVFKTKAVQAALAKYPKLTQDGACAIYLFTCESPLYRQLNQKLRQRDRTALKVRLSPCCWLSAQAPLDHLPRAIGSGSKPRLFAGLCACLSGGFLPVRPAAVRSPPGDALDQAAHGQPWREGGSSRRRPRGIQGWRGGEPQSH